MTKPVTRKMAVDCLLDRIMHSGCTAIIEDPTDGAYTCMVFVCSECGEPIFPGQDIQFDHIHADKLDGPHEYKNLRPVHYDPCHKRKSKKDVGALAKIDRITGVTKTKPKAKIKGGGFRGSRPFPKKVK